MLTTSVYTLPLQVISYPFFVPSIFTLNLPLATDTDCIPNGNYGHCLNVFLASSQSRHIDLIIESRHHH